jgi:hypothetical protein
MIRRNSPGFRSELGQGLTRGLGPSLKKRKARRDQGGGPSPMFGTRLWG